MISASFFKKKKKKGANNRLGSVENNKNII